MKYYLAIYRKRGEITALIPAKDFRDAFDKYKSSSWPNKNKEILKKIDFNLIEAEEK